MNTRVSESREKLQSLPDSRINQFCAALLAELGEPSNPNENIALSHLTDRDFTAAKEMCLTDPCSSYLAAISCMASAYRSPMVADSVLRDAARHTVEVVKRNAERRIAQSFQSILNHSE